MSRHTVPRRAFFGLLWVLMNPWSSGLGTLLGSDPRTSGVFLPTSPEEEAIWDQLVAARDQGQWDSVLDVLSRVTTWIVDSTGDHVLSLPNSTALSVRRRYAEFIAQLPSEVLERHRSRTDGVIADVWAAAAEEGLPWSSPSDLVASETREVVRHRIIRDYRESSVYPAAIKSEISNALLSGDWETSRDILHEVLGSISASHGDVNPNNEENSFRWNTAEALRFCALAGLTAAATNDEGLRRQAMQTLTHLNSAKKVSPALESTYEKAKVALSDKDLTPRTQEDSDRREAGSPGAEEPYKLGGRITAQSVQGSELRTFMTERMRWVPRGRAPLPYGATRDKDTVVFQHEDGITAIDSKSLKKQWHIAQSQIGEPPLATRIPVIENDVVYIVHGATTIAALEKQTGSGIWHASIKYDGISKTLQITRSNGSPAESDTRRDGVAPEYSPKQDNQEGATKSEGQSESSRLSMSLPAVVPKGIVFMVHCYADKAMRHFAVALTIHGQIRWQTYLGLTEQPNFYGMAGVSSQPTYSEGAAFCLTNGGILAKLDVVDGAILSMTSYLRLGSSGQREAARVEGRWCPNPVLLASDKVIIAPQDSAELIAVSRKTGHVLWRQHRSSSRYLVGLIGQNCIVVGESARAVDCLTGKYVWETKPSNSQATFHLEGRPAIDGKYVFLPDHEALITIDGKTGAVVGQTMWELESDAGNLLVVNNKLVVIAPEGMCGYSDVVMERSLIDQLDLRGQDAFLQRAKHFLRNYNSADALSALRAWSDSIPLTATPNSATDSLHLQIAGLISTVSKDPKQQAVALELLSYRPMLERNLERKVAAYIDLGNRLHLRGDTGRALEAFYSALKFDNPSTAYQLDDTVELPSYVYIRHRLREITRGILDKSLMDPIEKRAMAEVESARVKGTPASSLEIIRNFPFTQAAAVAYKELSDMFHDRLNDQLSIAALQTYLEEYPTSEDDVVVRLKLAALLDRQGSKNKAKDVYQAALRRYADVKDVSVPGMKPGETIGQYIVGVLETLNYKAIGAQSAELVRPIRMEWRSPADLGVTQKSFLAPTGIIPKSLERCFFTQSMSMIECRDSHTGIPRWSVSVETIPDFQFAESPFGLGFRYPSRVGSRSFEACLVSVDNDPQEHLAEEKSNAYLVINDDRNVFAIESITGATRWHIPFGVGSAPFLGDRALRPKEFISGVAASIAKVCVVTSQSRLLQYDIRTGELTGEASLKFLPDRYGPFIHDNNVFLTSVDNDTRGTVVHAFSIGLDGGARVRELTEKGLLAMKGPLRSKPVRVSGSLFLLHGPSEVSLIDLESHKHIWSYTATGRGDSIDGMYWTEENPDDVVLTINRANDWPAIVCLSASMGADRWRYEKLPAARSSSHVVWKNHRYFILYGREQWSLFCLQETDAEAGRSAVASVWKQPISLGFVQPPVVDRLRVSEDAIYWLGGYNSLSVFDRETGSPIAEDAGVINRFLMEKQNLSINIRDGRLVVLTDGGDAGFTGRKKPEGLHCLLESQGGDLESSGDATVVGLQLQPGRQDGILTKHFGSSEESLIFDYLNDPTKLDTTVNLALNYFGNGYSEPAIRVLSRALMSERLASDGDAKRHFVFRYLLDGVKEEQMRSAVDIPKIYSLRSVLAPVIDGELADDWSISNRITLDSPRNIGAIGGAVGKMVWDGAEDLSAVLYTGWDDKYFYFALDVTDDALYPYDRDSENWRGDCLLIGLDPTGDGGFRQHGNDQLMTLALTIPKRNKLKKENETPNSGEDEEDKDDQDKDVNKPDGLFAVRKKDDDSGAVYEVGLPWTSFGLPENGARWPKPGMSFGLSLLLTDDDNGQGAEKTLSLNPCHLLPQSQKAWIWRFVIPSFFPRVTLE